MSKAKHAASLKEVQYWARHPAFLLALETFTARRGISTAGVLRAPEGFTAGAFPGTFDSPLTRLTPY